MLYRFALEFDNWETFTLVEQKRIQWDAIRALVGANCDYIRRISVPLLYDSGCRFIAENQPFVLNCWHNIPRVLELGGSHCVGLTAWRVAELRMKFHEDALPFILDFEEQVAGVSLQEFHFVVKRANGQIEDPSRLLGMP